jgi:hypothetical protein
MKKLYQILVGNFGHFGDFSVDEKNDMTMGAGFVWFRYERVDSWCEHSTETSDPIKIGKILGHLSIDFLLKNKFPSYMFRNIIFMFKLRILRWVEYKVS